MTDKNTLKWMLRVTRTILTYNKYQTWISTLLLKLYRLTWVDTHGRIYNIIAQRMNRKIFLDELLSAATDHLNAEILLHKIAVEEYRTSVREE